MVKRMEPPATRKSIVIFNGAVSVLWRGQKPDWNCLLNYCQANEHKIGL